MIHYTFLLQNYKQTFTYLVSLSLKLKYKETCIFLVTIVESKLLFSKMPFVILYRNS